MKKMGFFLAVVGFVLLGCMSVMAAPKYDTTNVENGYVTVTYDGVLKDKLVKIKLEVVGSQNYNTFTVITNNPVNIPLTLGNGTYKLTIMERVSGNSYRGVGTHSFEAKITNPNGAFLVPSPIVDYNPSTKTVNEFIKIYADNKITAPAMRTEKLYAFMTKEFKYDHEKAKNINTLFPDGYTPVIDTAYAARKGICYDYSAITAAVLRANGIPTKVVWGYAPEVGTLHSWNEIFIDGKWVVADFTVDAAYAEAGYQTTMAKDGKLFTPTKIY